MSETQDDLIIAVWLRRSLGIFLALALIAGLVVLALMDWGPAREGGTEAVLDGPVSSQASKPRRPLPVLAFSEEATDRGLAFEFENGAYGQRFLPETMVGGVAVLDFDNDGDPDLLLTGGNRWPFEPGSEPLVQTIGLFENDGAGHFSRVDQALGLQFDGYAMAAAVGDYDGDGYLDIFVTAVGPNVLFRNVAGGAFERTSQVPGEADEWSTAATFFDADNDGWLDLFVTQYVQWNRDLDLAANYQIAGIGRAYGPPTNFPGSLPRLYRNLGNGRFEDVSDDSGIRSVPLASAKSLAVAARDVDNDGDTDLFVANDTTANFLYLNDGSGRFTERGQALGVAFDNTGKATGAMGVDLAQVMGPGTTALAVGNFANEMTSFFVDHDSQMLFADDAVISGVGPASRQALTFGLFFADLDLDGYEDLLQVNGHVENEINRVQAGQHYRQSAQVFWHCAPDCPRRFVPLPDDHIGALAQPLAGRGGAYADIDGDGDLDIVIAETGGPVRLLINPANNRNHWLRVRLQGRAPNTHALGARLTLSAGDRLQTRTVTPTRSYLSQTELVATFGLGAAIQAEWLQVDWPDGKVSRLENIEANQLLEVTQ